MSQEKHIEKVMERFQMTEAKATLVPFQPQVKLSKAHCPKDKEETLKCKISHMLQLVGH